MGHPPMQVANRRSPTHVMVLGAPPHACTSLWPPCVHAMTCLYPTHLRRFRVSRTPRDHAFGPSMSRSSAISTPPLPHMSRLHSAQTWHVPIQRVPAAPP